jgi:phospholipid/cholesterol/gamma-HCH transport system permease protein
VLGGATVAVSSLHLTWAQFLAELQRVMETSDVWTGLVKSFAFGLVIALIGCRRGLLTHGAAEGVGRSTTSTIVECLFAIVILDTLFTWLFRGAGV